MVTNSSGLPERDWLLASQCHMCMVPRHGCDDGAQYGGYFNPYGAASSSKEMMDEKYNKVLVPPLLRSLGTESDFSKMDPIAWFIHLSRLLM